MNIRYVLSLLLLVALVGCTARPPYDDLVAEAEQTGDWSAVRKYERMNKKMGVVDGNSQCKNGYVFVCGKKSATEECGCVSPLDTALR